ncbi:unnamed protein product [Effrenium voratum]|nr:unnamed protein product [Effrenium voratum]
MPFQMPFEDRETVKEVIDRLEKEGNEAAWRTERHARAMDISAIKAGGLSFALVILMLMALPLLERLRMAGEMSSSCFQSDDPRCECFLIRGWPFGVHWRLSGGLQAVLRRHEPWTFWGIAADLRPRLWTNRFARLCAAGMPYHERLPELSQNPSVKVSLAAWKGCVRYGTDCWAPSSAVCCSCSASAST